MIRFTNGGTPGGTGGEAEHGSGCVPTGVSPDVHRMETLGDRIATLAARVHAATYRLLVWIREFDELFERCGGNSGFRSSADWLAWRTGMSRSASRERVRVARALADLPLVSRAMAEGRLSFSKVRAIARLAPLDRDAEERLLEYALAGTACHLERLVRAWRRLGRVAAEHEERERHERRHLVLFPDDDGSWVVRGRLDPEVGALLSKALEMAVDTLFREKRGDRPTATSDPAGRHGVDHGQRLADAIGLASELALSAGSTTNGGKNLRVPSTSADRFQVILHVDLETLAMKRDEAPRGISPSRFAFLDDHVGVSAETARRLCCDAGRVPMLHGDGGNVLDVGRKTRTIPPALARAVDFRDGGRCRFPGCSARGRDRHHVEHWVHGGETRLENLVLLCRFHHRAVHEGGFRVEAQNEGGFRFRRPDGRILPEAPRTPPTAEESEPEGIGSRADGACDTIGPWTATPDWDGSPPDYDWMLSGLAGTEASPT